MRDFPPPFFAHSFPFERIDLIFSQGLGVVSVEDVLASVARAHVAMARHRQKVGGLSRDELERLKGRPLNTTEEAFLREVQGKGES